MTQQTKWNLKSCYNERAVELADQCKISIILAQLLINRGIDSPKGVHDFLSPTLQQLHSPWLLPDMDKAVSIINEAASSNKVVLIYGDYDADGVTSTALLYDFLSHLGLIVNYYIPDRFHDGYGLTKSGIDKALEKFDNTQLIITVDCGISSVTEISELVTQGYEVIVTDHHEQLEELPPAQAVVNPKIDKSEYPFPYLAGVGVALKLVQAIESNLTDGKIDEQDGNFNSIDKYLDLVTIGTIADLVPLTGENRSLVYNGLTQLSDNRLGLQALITLLGLDAENVTAGQVGFLLAPRINAAGRLASAEQAVDLLVTDDFEKAEKIASELDQDNRERQQVEREITREAEQIIETDNLTEFGPVLVVWNENWHEGVIGIVASRILEKYHRPVIVLTVDEHAGLAKGSCRSIPGFHMAEALQACSNHLVKYGGHELAAGLTLEKKDIPEFVRQINNLACEHLEPQDLVPTLDIDILIPVEKLSDEVAKEVESLEPFGIGNPRPTMGCSNLKLTNIKPVGKEKNHLQLKFKDENNSNLQAIWFQGAESVTYDYLQSGKYTQIAFTPKINTYNYTNNGIKGGIDLQIKDLQLTDSCFGTVYDYRYCQKHKVINELVNSEIETIILVNSNHRKSKLQNLFPSVNVERVIDNHYESHSNNNTQLILYDLPYDPKFIRQWVGWTGPGKIYLLYNSKDKELNKYMWDIAIPTKDILILSFDILAEIGLSQKSFKTIDLKSSLEERYNTTLTKRLITKIITIFLEMQIVHYENVEYRICDKVRHSGFIEEQDLNLSSTFLAEKHRYEELKIWEELFLNSTSSALSMLMYYRDISPELIRSYLT